MPTSKWTAARVAKLFLEISMGLAGVAALVFLVLLLFTPFLRHGSETDVTSQVAVGGRTLLPVAPLTLQNNPTNAPGEFRSARLVKGYGELRLITTRHDLHWAMLVLYFLAYAMMLVVIWALRGVVTNALAGRPFDRRNARLLRLTGLVLLVGGCLWPVAQYLLARAVLVAAPVDGFPLAPAFRFSTDPLLVGLLLLVLAAVFSHGADLEEERSLTV